MPRPLQVHLIPINGNNGNVAARPRRRFQNLNSRQQIPRNLVALNRARLCNRLAHTLFIFVRVDDNDLARTVFIVGHLDSDNELNRLFALPVFRNHDIFVSAPQAGGDIPRGIGEVRTLSLGELLLKFLVRHSLYNERTVPICAIG